MKMKIWVISQDCFGDENYNEPEQGGWPIESFRNEIAARNRQSDLNEQAFENNNLFEYMEDPGVRLSDVQELDGCAEFTDLEEVSCSWTDIPRPSRREIWSLSDCAPNYFYSIKAIEVSDCQVFEPVGTEH